MEEKSDKTIAEAVQDAAGERFGVARWNRPAIFREAIAAASDTGLSYWLVLGLSGAIATLGLALDSSAVVIGAMLVAPFLAPIVGLALALAVGDTRLAVQTGLVVVASTLLVITISAVLTLLLPFHTITLEISARTRPTTLDLAVAIFSGLVGAVVTLSRGSRLSAAIPGVAIAVALIPPLAVAGFGIGIGGDLQLILGAMLLYGANLAGIILSGMLLFMLVGMHRKDVSSAAIAWHREEDGKAAWVNRLPGVGSLGVAKSTWARMGLVGGFVVALGFPLSASLEEIGREVRIERAIAASADAFEIEGRSSVLDRRVNITPSQTDVRLRVATTEWFDAEDEERFEVSASAMAGERINLYLEQLPATGGDLEQLASLLPDQAPVERTIAPPVTATPLPELLNILQQRLSDATGEISLPAGVALTDMEIAASQAGATVVRITYRSESPLSSDAEEIIAGQIRRELGISTLAVSLAHSPAEETTDVEE